MEAFIILDKLGQGALSTVYKVQRITDGSIFALKEVRLNNLTQKQRQSAQNQAAILSSLCHPNIISYEQSFVQNQKLYLLMEYAEHGDLQTKIKNAKESGISLPEAEIWNYIYGIGRALYYLHTQNIIHRDLKSANVLLSQSGVKLADLNVSKRLSSSRELCVTQIGTPYYASPEVWEDKPYDSKSDVWAFGCIIYEAATFQPPFKSNTMEGLYKKIIKGIYPKLPAYYSADLKEVIRQLLQVNPQYRPSIQKLLYSPQIQLHHGTKECKEIQIDHRKDSAPVLASNKKLNLKLLPSREQQFKKAKKKNQKMCKIQQSGRKLTAKAKIQTQVSLTEIQARVNKSKDLAEYRSLKKLGTPTLQPLPNLPNRRNRLDIKLNQKKISKVHSNTKFTEESYCYGPQSSKKIISYKEIEASREGIEIIQNNKPHYWHNLPKIVS